MKGGYTSSIDSIIIGGTPEIVDTVVATNSTHVLPTCSSGVICSRLNSRSSSDSQSGKQRLELLLLLFYSRK